MAKKQKKKKKAPASVEIVQPKDFLDMIAPAAVKFNTDSYILGSSCRCVLALRGYPASTEELALLCHLGEKSGTLLHIFVRQVPTAVEYIRNSLKRVRKKESSLIMASQNLEDFDAPGVREMTRPLFAIPTHQFLFNAGSVDRRFYMDNLQLEESEFELIQRPQNGVCLFKCGNERYLLEVHAPEHIKKLFGEGGGR